MITYVMNEIVVTEPVRFQTYADRLPAILARASRESPEHLAILPIHEPTSTSRVYIVGGYAG